MSLSKERIEALCTDGMYAGRFGDQAEWNELRELAIKALAPEERYIEAGEFVDVGDGIGTCFAEWKPEVRAACYGSVKFYVEERIINQCDGCRRGLPVVRGIHRDDKGYAMACSRDRYVSTLRSRSE